MRDTEECEGCVIAPMHPPLVAEKHPLCAEVAQHLADCHANVGLLGKMLGRCNAQKAALDRCLREQSRFKREKRKSEGKVWQ